MTERISDPGLAPVTPGATRRSSDPAIYPAELYAAVHTGIPGDVAFYRRFCAGARTVLELGVGAGRVARALCDDGLHVTGVDNHGGLLELARERAPRTERIRGDFRTLDLRRKFDRVLCPFNGLYCPLDEEGLLQTLKVARAHLEPSGLFAFDVYSADAFHYENALPHEKDGDHAEIEANDSGTSQVDMPELLRTVDALGTRWDVFEHSRWDRGKQRIDAVYDHVPRDGRPRLTATIPQRYLLAHEIEPLLAEAGLTLLALHGDFDESDAEADARIRVGIARVSVTG